MNPLLSAFCLALGVTSALPLCSETIAVAGGGPPNSGLPSLVSKATIKELQLALFLENLESAFYSAGSSNIAGWGVYGYPNDTVGVVSKIAAQEAVHVASLQNLLVAYNETPIPPCNYSFPVNSTEGFFELAHVIESVGIGAIIGITERIATADPLFERTVSSVLTVEARHDAFFRQVAGAVPNPSPFDTGIGALWAYNLALPFIIPGSCPVELPLPILPRLTFSQSCSETSLNNSTSSSPVEFTWDPTQTSFVVEARKPLLIGWVNQLNIPVYTTLNITATGTGITQIPPGMSGVAFAVVTVQEFDNIKDLELAALAGPVVVPLS